MTLSVSSSIVLSNVEREEMKIGKADIHLHSISSHFASALYPVALLSLFLHAIHGGELYSRVYFYLMLLATASVPFTYLTGILEWKQKYKGAKVPIFLKKIRLGMALFVLGMACTTWYWLDPDIL